MRLQRPGRTLSAVAALFALGVAGSEAATFTVTTTADAGAGSLRQAILDANGAAGADTIQFALVGSGVQTIAPASALPSITAEAAQRFSGLDSAAKACSIVARAAANFTGISSVPRRIVASTSVMTKLPLFARPEPFAGNESCGSASMRSAERGLGEVAKVRV